MEIRTVEIRGMHCDHCVAAVRRELTSIPGMTILEVRVGSATISYDPAAIPLERIGAAVRKAGFTLAE